MTMGFDDAGGQRRQVLSVFDFDGTLTRHDSFIPIPEVCLRTPGIQSTHFAACAAKRSIPGSAFES